MKDDKFSKIIILNPPLYRADRPNVGADIAKAITPFLNNLHATLKQRHSGFSHFTADLQFNQRDSQFILSADLVWTPISEKVDK
jgi:hypothetical protein